MAIKGLLPGAHHAKMGVGHSGSWSLLEGNLRACRTNQKTGDRMLLPSHMLSRLAHMQKSRCRQALADVSGSRQGGLEQTLVQGSAASLPVSQI